MKTNELIENRRISLFLVRKRHKDEISQASMTYVSTYVFIQGHSPFLLCACSLLVHYKMILHLYVLFHLKLVVCIPVHGIKQGHKKFLRLFIHDYFKLQ